jgi:hypothetical protein
MCSFTVFTSQRSTFSEWRLHQKDQRALPTLEGESLKCSTLAACEDLCSSEPFAGAEGFQFCLVQGYYVTHYTQRMFPWLCGSSYM